MKTISKLASAFFVLIFVPEFAQAAGGKPAGIESLLWPVVNFVLFASLLIYLYKKQIAGLLKARKANVLSQIDLAGKEIREAGAVLEEVESRYASLEQEKEAFRARYQEETKSLSEFVIKDSLRQAEQIEKDSFRKIEAEQRATEKEVRAALVQSAADAARKKLSTSLAEEEDARIRNSIIESSF